MRNCIFKIALDIQILVATGYHLAYRANFYQHALEVEEIVTAKDSLAVSREDAMQICHCEFMSQLGEALSTGNFGIGIDQIKRDKNLAHHGFFHLLNATDNSFFTDREMVGAMTPEDRVQ